MRTFSNAIFACLCGVWSYSNTVSNRLIFTLGKSIGIRIIDCCLCTGAFGSVFFMKIAILYLGSPALEDHHFRLLIMYSVPSRMIFALMFVVSEEAMLGSVIAKHER